MTFLRKRSRSQCSIFSSDDESTCSRKHKKETRRYSGESTNTQVTAADFPIDDSCVLRNVPKHKLAHFQFLYWVAFTRKFTDAPITDAERRTCPLLWCRTVFADEEAMLRHVWHCDHLSEGLYWCFQCQKPERIGKFHGRGCPGGSSKTERMTTAARKMFSALGSTRGRSFDRDLATPVPETRSVLPEISEESEEGVECQEWVSTLPNAAAFEPPDDGGRSCRWDPPSLSELPNNGICEMEAAYVSEMSADWHFPQEIPDSQISGESASNRLEVAQINPFSTHDTYSQPLLPWNFLKEPSPMDHESPRRPRSSLPRLNTSMSNASYEVGQSSYNNSWQSSEMAATIVSPLSPTGGFDFRSLDVLIVSPTDISPTATEKSLFTDSGYSSGTIDSSWGGSNSSGSLLLHDSTRSKGKKRKLPDDAEKLLPGSGGDHGMQLDPHVDFQHLSYPQELTFSTDLIVFGAITSTNATNHPERSEAPEMPKILSPHWSDSKNFVTSFSDVLNKQVQHSRASLRQMAPNTIVRELLSLSTSSIVSIGLEVLAGLFQGRRPAAVISIFSFTHIAYALAISVDHDHSKVQTTEWFQDSLALLENLPEQPRQAYTQIVRILWQPRAASALVDSLAWTDSLLSMDEDNNRLITACKHFLDIQESFTSRENSVPLRHPTAQFNFTQASLAHTAKNYVFNELIKNYPDDRFVDEVALVERRLELNLITSIRQLELELTCAAKNSSEPNSIYTQITILCNKLYGSDTTSRSRNSHHLEAISITQRLLPAEEYSEEACDDEADFEFDLPDSGYSTMDFSNGLGEDMIASVEAFAREADAILNHPNPFNAFSTASHTQPQPHTFDPRTQSTSFEHSFTSSSSLSVPQQPHSRLSPSSARSITPTNSKGGGGGKYKCHCGYAPTGEERWKASNLARHKRTQHPPDTSRKWRCGWRGCTSEFTRSDNLRSHQRDKGHDNSADLGVNFSDTGSGELGMGEIGMVLESGGGGDGSQDPRARPPKKRRKSDDRGMGLR